MYKSKIMTVPFVFLLGSSLILSSCRGAPPSVPSPTHDTTLPVIETPQPASERTLKYCMSSGLESLYPYNDKSLNKSIFLETIYDGPIDSRSYDFKPVILKKLPSLADGDAQILPVTVKAGDQVVDAAGNLVTLEAGVRVRPSGCQADDCAIEYDGTSTLQMDQLVVRFELLTGLLWSDGAPLTASDSVYSFKLQSDPDTPVDKEFLLKTASYQALGEHTSEWKGLPGYLDNTYFNNYFTPAPEHAWGQYTALELLTAEESSQKPLGWGPYIVEEWNPEEGITLRKNENYFRSSEGLPRFDKLVMRFMDADLNADLAMLYSGECDVLGAPTGVGVISAQESELLLELSNTGKITATFSSGTYFWHLDFGIQPASYDDGWQADDRPDFFGDVRVRRAFALCLDRQQMMEDASLNQSFVPDTYIPPQHPLYNPNVTQYKFDPVAGSALLEEAGWVMGQDGVRTYTGDNPRIPPGTTLLVENFVRSSFDQGAEQVMVASLAQCGIEMVPSYYEGNPLFADGPEGPVFGRNFELAQFVWLTGSEPPCDLWLSESIPGEDLAIFPSGWAGQNNTGFSNAEYDQACRNALLALPGQPGYVENHQLAQQIFSDQLPVIILYYSIITGATRPDFCGYILDPTISADTWNVEEFDYGPDC